jgi:hypothetical protein
LIPAGLPCSKIISIQSAKRYCDLNASSTLRFKPNRIISKILWENLDLLEITPAPAKTIGKAIISSPEITRNLRVCFLIVALLVPYRPQLLYGYNICKIVIKRTTVEGNILLAVLPETLNTGIRMLQQLL